MIERKQRTGFALDVVLAVVAIVVIVGGLGYVYYTRTHQKSTTASTTSVNAKPGTTGHVLQDISDEMQSESTAETSADSSAQQAVTNITGSASNVGGAYNENSL